MQRTEIAYIGSGPAEEEIAQLGRTDNFSRYNQLEVATYHAAIVARYGPPPPGVCLRRTSCAHDFGTYVELQAVSNSADDGACAYLGEVENGLARWMDVGFSAPVIYDERSQVRERVYIDQFEAVRRVLVTLERQRIHAWGSAAEAAYIANLRAAYPAQAEEADQLLRQINTEQEIRSATDRRVRLFAPYRLTFFPAMFNDERGSHFPKGDVVDVTAFELRTGRHRYIRCDLGSAVTPDDALEMCWEHMARYVIA